MEEYSKIVKQCKRENDFINELQLDLDALQVDCRLAKIPQSELKTDPAGTLDVLIKNTEVQYSKILEEKSLNNIILYDNVNNIDNELNKIFEYQLNCQLLKEKPYVTCIAVDYSTVQSTSSQVSTCTNTYDNYFESVEKYTSLMLNHELYTVDKILTNDELDYFTVPCDNVNYKELLWKHLFLNLSKVINFVRRVQAQKNFVTTSFKPKKKASQENNLKQIINNMNRKLTLLFLEFEEDLLHQVVRSIKPTLWNEENESDDMIQDLIDPDTQDNLKSVNFVTTNLDDTIECEIQIVVMSIIPNNFEGILQDLIAQWKIDQSMVNIFMQVHQNVPDDMKEAYDSATADKLEIITKYWSQYVTSNSHLFFF